MNFPPFAFVSYTIRTEKMHRLQSPIHLNLLIVLSNKIKVLLTLQVNNQDLKKRPVRDSSAKKIPCTPLNAAERLICDLTDEELKVCSLTDLFTPKTDFSTVLAIPFFPCFNSSSILSR